jgi:U3 small nucleolar RNA-associated protein 14
MDLRHKNTSKWAKMALQYGHTDKSLRSAYHESVQLGHELSEKINESVQQKDKASGDDEMVDHSAEGKSRAAVSSEASKAIAQLLSESGGPSEEEAVLSGGRYKKLFEMDFMRKAADQQRSRAREDAQSILREIQQMENECEQSDDDADGGSKVDPKRKVEPSAEELFSARREVSSLFASSSGMAVSSKLKLRNKSVTTLHETRYDASSSSSIDITDFPDASSFRPLGHVDEASITEPLGDDNPWLQSMSMSAGAVSARKRKGTERGAKQLQVHEREQVYVHSSLMAVGSEAASVVMESDKQSIVRKASKLREKQAKRNDKRSKPGHDRKDDQQRTPPTAATSTDQPKIPLSAARSQADLVQQAFAGPDLEAEFRAYKKHEVDGEYGLDEKKLKVASEGE